MDDDTKALFERIRRVELRMDAIDATIGKTLEQQLKLHDHMERLLKIMDLQYEQPKEPRSFFEQIFGK